MEQSKQSAATVDAASKTAMSAVASLAPLYLLLSIKSRASLDHLHLGLFQVLFLLAFRFILDVTTLPATILTTLPFKQLSLPTPPTPTTPTPTAPAPKKHSGKEKKQKKLAGPRFPAAQLDSILHRTSPDGAITVLTHPTLPALYAIAAHLPDVPLKKLFGLLVDVGERPKWDGMCEGAESLEDVRDGMGRVAGCSYMQMKGMWPVKPKDLVLLSVMTRLPPAPSLVPSAPSTPVTRLVCATSSVLHPKKPPCTTHTRMSLNISGFIAESSGSHGSRIIQITDLSGLGSVPNFILTAVTGKMIPASLKKVGVVAKGYTSKRFPEDPEDESWMLPVLGDWQEGKDVEGAKQAALTATPLESEDDDDDDEDDDDEDPAEVLPPGDARSLSALLTQLRIVTTRLAALEKQKSSTGTAKQPQKGKSTWISSAVSAITGGGATDGGGDLGVQQAGAWKGLGVGVAGGVAGAATVFLMAVQWGRRKQR